MVFECGVLKERSLIIKMMIIIMIIHFRFNAVQHRPRLCCRPSRKKKSLLVSPQKYMAYLALCLQSHTCSNRCFFGPPWSKRWWVQHLAGGVVTDLREVYSEHLEQNTKCFFFKGCDWRCDSPPWLARLRNTVFFLFYFFFVLLLPPVRGN